MSNKMSSIYCLLFVLVITLVFSHFIDIPNMKEGFDSLPGINMTAEEPVDVLLQPAAAPGTSPSSNSPSSNSPSPSTDTNVPPGYGIPVKASPKESFQTRTRENTKHTNHMIRQKPSNNGIIDHIFTDKKSDFSLKQF
jgi:hypothetical protein